MRKLASCLALSLMCVSSWAAGQKTKDLPVTSTIFDFDSNNVPYFVQSDGQGPYQNGVAGVQSVLQTTANYAWLLNTYDSTGTVSSGRNAFITLGPANQESATATLPSLWSSWGTYLEPVRIITHGVGCPLLTIPLNGHIFCPLIIKFGPAITSGKTTTYYHLYMDPGTSAYNDPEAQEVQVSCTNTNASGQCNAWSIDSIPPTYQSGQLTGRVIAQLTKVSSTPSSMTFVKEGDFYLTFHILVTNP